MLLPLTLGLCIRGTPLTLALLLPLGLCIRGPLTLALLLGLCIQVPLTLAGSGDQRIASALARDPPLHTGAADSGWFGGSAIQYQ